MPAPAPKRRRLGISTVPAARLRAERPNYVWALVSHGLRIPR